MFSVLWYTTWIGGKGPGIVTPFCIWLALDALYGFLIFVLIKAATG